MRGEDISEFNARVRRGDLLPYTQWYRWQSNGLLTDDVLDIYSSPDNGANIYHSYRTGQASVFGDWRLSPSDVEAYCPQWYGEYLQQAVASIYNRGWDALTFIAELGDLYRMFSSLVKGLRSAQFPTGWRTIPNWWLQARYGWRPFFSDLESILGLLRHGLGNDMKRLSAKRCGVNQTTVSNSSFRDLGSPICDFAVTVKDVVIVQPTGSVIVDVVLPKIQFNVLQTAWEKIPFSFIVDWFIGFGDAIAAMSMLDLADKHYSACKGYKCTVRRSLSVESWPKSQYISGSYTCHGNSVGSITRRIPCVITKIPLPRLNLNVSKIIDLVSIVLQRIK